jgi:hypothetical protein
MSRPRQRTDDAVAEFAASYRERHGLEPGQAFTLPYWRRLTDGIDTSAHAARPDIAGWWFSTDDRIEPVYR